MFSIGEFSRLSGLTVKTLRFYHEKGILVPARVDEDTAYRYYDEANAERARLIARLRAMAFPLDDMAAVLACDDEADILEVLARHRADLARKARAYRRIAASIDQVIRNEREARSVMRETDYDVVEKSVEAQWIAGVRMKGHYSDCGKGFAKIGRALGRHLTGKPFCLYYDGEYREGDADFEACVPLKGPFEAEGISVRELPGGRCVTLLHRGPYDTLGRSYEKILAHIRDRGFEVVLPTREVYLKGPGMLLRGNPKNYLTEIQILLQEEGG